ncbi:AAA family ATPase [Streptacidiphilus jiangxiensis]|uniref:AAA domain-containing protein, putative AbiEii toxin, Type IV TA system n=1 Tax=Streptacidiphilus jiangxiensis TaxID=235985 RepID=A0A1H7RGP7_STRJI|nr:AAA family ATPase [Streptacidiphilus jiangxiensis]SEL59352.1 AAA domain-containing protein, putative AbiEii toxin, Type IV TA system [Streptacidiphilus jiangxiensis]
MRPTRRPSSEEDPLRIHVGHMGGHPEAFNSAARAVLLPNDWDDFGFRTSYDLFFRERPDSTPQLVGRVKIGRADQERGGHSLPAGELVDLDPRVFFSVGQDDTYYDNIRALGPVKRQALLKALCDIAFDVRIADNARHHEVTQTSLLRSVDDRTLQRQYKRIAGGGERLMRYTFGYVTPAHPSRQPTLLTFEVDPASAPRSNVHVLIGRNGVGKTTLLRGIAQAVVNADQPEPGAGRIGNNPDQPVGDTPFATVVSISFSAFDPVNAIPRTPLFSASYEYVGLLTPDDGRPKGRDDLASEFAASVENIARAGRARRWLHVLQMLKHDPGFAESPIHGYARHLRNAEVHEARPKNPMSPDGLIAIFKELSSGHALVLLTITRLTELVTQQTLVLLDEPEGHLHPPLLASFIKALSSLLTERNGVAIVATHSPVVLQEVPSSCVWKIGRRAERPEIETFGENVGVLTHEIFGLEVRDSSFHAEILEAVRELGTYQEVLARFGGQLGGEAKGLVRILLADKAAGEDI